MQRRHSLVFMLVVVVLGIQIAGCGGSKHHAALAISGTLPATGTVGTAYSGSLTASGGTAPYTWTISGLPAGVTSSGASSATLSVSGTPTTAASYSVSAMVTDSASATMTYTVSVVISAATGAGFTISPTTLGTLTVGTALTPITVTASPAGTQPYTWTVSSGSLPAGLFLNNGDSTNTTTVTSTTNSITITGTPTTSGAYSFTLSVNDSASPAVTGSQAYSGTVSSGSTEAACAATPTLRGNESALTLPYAYLLKGADSNDGPIYWAGSFTPDGMGGITTADLDFSSVDFGPFSYQVQVAGSSYSYGADGRGCLYLVLSGLNGGAVPAAAKHSSSITPKAVSGISHKHRKLHPDAVSGSLQTVTFSFSLSIGNQSGRMTEFDYANSGFQAAGQMHQQTSADFVVANLAPKFAFGIDGWYLDPDNNLDRAAIAGTVSNASGTLSDGFADANIIGNVFSTLSGGTGSLEGSTVSETTGRGTGSFTITTTGGPFAFDFVYYIVNKSDLYIISSDGPTNGNYVVAGRALEAAATPVALNGYYVPILSGIDFNVNETDGDNVVTIGTANLLNNGTIPAAKIYTNDAGTYVTNSYTNGTYALDTSTGRISVTGVTETPPVGYLTATASEDDIAAFLVGTDGATSSGYLALQATSAPNLSNSSVSGNFIFGTSEDVVGITGSEVGAYNFTGTGTYSATIDIVDVANSADSANQASNGTITVNSDGSGTIVTPGGNLSIVTGGSAIVAIDAGTTQQPLLYYFIQQVAPTN
jgi:hypothetical protein